MNVVQDKLIAQIDRCVVWHLRSQIHQNQVTRLNVGNRDFAKPLFRKIVQIQVVAVLPPLVSPVIVPQLYAVLPRVPVTHKGVAINDAMNKHPADIGLFIP